MMKKVLCIFLSVLMVLSLAACGQKSETAPEGPSWQEQYDLGIRYLSEGKYEEAILAFTAAIEIDPKRAEAYAKAAEAYEAVGDLDGAISLLEQGIAAGADSLQELLDTLLEEPLPVEDDFVQLSMEFEVLPAWGVPLENVEVFFEGDPEYASIYLSASVSSGPLYSAFNMCDSSYGDEVSLEIAALSADEMEQLQQWGHPTTDIWGDMWVFPASSPYNIYRLWDSSGEPAGAGWILVERNEEAEAWLAAHPDTYTEYYE